MSVIVVGSINQDIISFVEQYPKKGDTIFGEKIEYFYGGKGANQATTIARLRKKVYLISAVGDDSQGEEIIENLQKSNVNTDYIKMSASKETGTTIVTIDHTAENTMQVFKGANDDLTNKDVIKAMDSIMDSNILLVQMEIPQQSAITSMKTAKEKGVYVVLDPAPADGMIVEALKYADLITPNQQETKHLVGIDVFDENSALKAAKAFEEIGVNSSIIKMGSKGSLVYENGSVMFIPPVKVNPVDTVGAGDAFAGAIAAGLSNGESLLNSAKFANIVAAISITKFGAQTAIPTIDEVKKFIKEKNLQTVNCSFLNG